MFADLVDIDRIGLAQDLELVAGNLAGAADRKAGTREGMAADETVGQAQLPAKGTHLVLEELTQGFDQLQAHLFRQAADIMVRLDRHRRPARETDGFDHVGVKRALGQKLRALDGICVFLEHVDEEPANDLALGLGVGLAVEFPQEQLGFVGVDQGDVVIVAEHGHDLVRLVLPQKPVIDENAGKLIANRLMDQHGGDRAVDAAREAADHLLVADLLADLANGLFAVSAHGPVAGKARRAHEVFVKHLAVRGVMHLGVELHRIEVPRGIGGDGIGRVGRGAEDLETGGELADVIAMAHPDLFAVIGEPAVEQGQRIPRRGHEGAAKLGSAAAAGNLAAFDRAAQILHHDLLPVTDTEDRHAERIGRFRRSGAALAGDRIGAAGKDDRLGGKRRQKIIGDILIGVDFAIDVQLAQAAGNKLRYLAAEVDDQKAVMGCLAHARCLDASFVRCKRGNRLRRAGTFHARRPCRRPTGPVSG